LWTENKFEEFTEKRAELILTKLIKYTSWKNVSSWKKFTVKADNPAIN
jgi:hypothetical protein